MPNFECRSIRIATRGRTSRSASSELHLLPAYAPHLDPDELVNAELKRRLADKLITAETESATEARAVLRSLRQLPDRGTGFFGAPHTSCTPA